MIDAIQVIELAIPADRKPCALDQALGNQRRRHIKERVAATAIEQMLLIMDRHIGDIRRLLRERTDHDVTLAIGDGEFQFLRRPEHQVDEDVGAQRHESIDDALQGEMGTGDDPIHDAHPQSADQLAIISADALLKGIDIGEQALHGGVGLFAKRGQAKPAPTAQAQGAAQGFLQGREMGAQRRLRKIERNQGIGEISRLDEGQEHPQQAEIDIIEVAHGRKRTPKGQDSAQILCA